MAKLVYDVLDMIEHVIPIAINTAVSQKSMEVITAVRAIEAVYSVLIVPEGPSAVNVLLERVKLIRRYVWQIHVSAKICIVRTFDLPTDSTINTSAVTTVLVDIVNHALMLHRLFFCYKCNIILKNSFFFSR